MSTVLVFGLLAATISPPPIQNTATANSSVTHPSLVEVPKNVNGLTLYNAKGEVVARCEKKGDTFQNCKMESGVNLDDLMNAWLHAYLDVQK